MRVLPFRTRQGALSDSHAEWRGAGEVGTGDSTAAPAFVGQLPDTRDRIARTVAEPDRPDRGLLLERMAGDPANYTFSLSC
ncbi:hypothetical protein Sa4125_17110 [Aureimonas sp. SA4125]|nr:hypothetical protein Sa4125_17110 [Aureimonas sp. SA4125]